MKPRAKSTGRAFSAEFTQKTKITATFRCGCSCSFIENGKRCGDPLYVPDSKNTEGAIYIGEACHIYPAASLGPRHLESKTRSITDDFKSSVKNCLMCCKAHGKMLDQNGHYSADELFVMKRSAENALSETKCVGLEKHIVGKKTYTQSELDLLRVLPVKLFHKIVNPELMTFWCKRILLNEDNLQRVGIHGTLLEEELLCPEIHIVRGNQGSGKTSFLQYQALTAMTANKTVMRLSGRDLDAKSLNVKKLVRKRLGVDLEHATILDGMAIIDDFDENVMTQSERVTFLFELYEVFQTVIVSVEGWDRENINNQNQEYMVWDLMEVGDLEVRELATAWYATTGANIDVVNKAVNIFRGKYESLRGRCFFHNFPSYVLICLQALEANQIDLSKAVGSNAFFYDILIKNNLLAVAKDSQSASSVLSFLEYIAFKLSQQPCTTLQTLANLYQEDYELDVCSMSKITDLVEHLGYLKDVGGLIRYKQGYHQYYFAAGYIAKNKEKVVVKAYLDELIETLHLVESENILLFLSYLTVDQRIKAVLITTLTTYLTQVSRYQIDDDDASGFRLIGDEPELTTEAIFKVLHTINVAGQILKNNANMLRDEKRELINALAGCILRLCNGVYRGAVNEIDALVEELEPLVLRSNAVDGLIESALNQEKRQAEIELKRLRNLKKSLTVVVNFGFLNKLATLLNEEFLMRSVAHCLKDLGMTGEFILYLIKLELGERPSKEYVSNWRRRSGAIEGLLKSMVIHYLLTKKVTSSQFHQICADFDLKLDKMLALTKGG